MRSSRVAPEASQPPKEDGADTEPLRSEAREGKGTADDSRHGARRRWLHRQNPSQARKDLKRELVTTDAFAVVWKPAVFARMLLWHLTYPVCLPVMYAVEGWHLCKNTGFIFRNWQDSWFNFGSSVLFWVALVVLAAQPPGSELTHIVHTPETMAMILSFLVQKLTIATKYAYMPQERFERFRTTHVSVREAHEMQLGSGWLSIPPRTVKHGVEAAAVRLGSEGTKRYFVLDECAACFREEARPAPLTPGGSAEIARAREMLRTPVHLMCGASVEAGASASVVGLVGNSPLWAHALETAMTSNRLSVPLLCMYLVLVHEGAGERWIKRAYKGLLPLLVLINMGIPFLARAIAGRPLLGHSFATASIVLLVPFLTAGWLSVMILFLFIGVLDYRRRQLYMRRVGALVQPSLKPESATYPLPRVSLRQPANFKSWMATRRIVLSFGLDFWRRIQVYITYMGMVFGVLLLWYTVELLSGRPSVDLTAFVLVDAAVLFALLLPMLHYGELTNQQASVHARVFVNAQLDLRDELIGHSRALPPMGDRVAGAADGRLAHKRLAAQSGTVYGSTTPHAAGPIAAPSADATSSSASPLPAGFISPSSFTVLSHPSRTLSRLQGSAMQSPISGAVPVQGPAPPPSPLAGAEASAGVDTGRVSAARRSQPPSLPPPALQLQMMDACVAAGLDPQLCAPVLGARVRIATPAAADTMPLHPAPGLTVDGELSTAAEEEEEEKEGAGEDSGLNNGPRLGQGGEESAGAEGGAVTLALEGAGVGEGAPHKARASGGGASALAPKASSVRGASLTDDDGAGGAAVGMARGGGTPVARPPLHVPPGQAPDTSAPSDGKTVMVNAALVSSQQLEQCDALCQALEEALLGDVEADPTTLLGFRASKTVLRSLIVLGASTGSLVLRVLTGQ